MNPKSGKILIVDDDEDVLQAAHLLLKQQGITVRAEKNPERIQSLLNGEAYDVILLDMNFARDITSGSEGFFWLKKIIEIDPASVVILITAYGDVEMAVRAIKEGATDFVLKPWQNEKLLATISAAMNLRQMRMEVVNLKSRQKQLSADLDQPFHDFIGVCPPMQKVFETIQKVAKTDANILILGENGTGKELVARELHRQSLRAAEPFISVDMGAVSETLFESELFGHVKGAFTDAREDRAGRFETASGGTLLLDEIGNLTLPLQAKILTVLEERNVIRLGSNKPRPIDVRLVCASNMPIYEMVAEKKFRQDLLYRINTVEIHLPPLRARHQDVPLLVDHFLKIYLNKYKKFLKPISRDVLIKLQKYHWPGNVRELRHTMERVVILSESEELRPSDFIFTATDSKEEILPIDSYSIEEVEKMLIRKVLSKNEGNISRAAQDLGLTRTSLYRRLTKYGI